MIEFEISKKENNQIIKEHKIIKKIKVVEDDKIIYQILFRWIKNE